MSFLNILLLIVISTSKCKNSIVSGGTYLMRSGENSVNDTMNADGRDEHEKHVIGLLIYHYVQCLAAPSGQHLLLIWG